MFDERTDPYFLRLLEQSARQTPSYEVQREQRISWVFGQLPASSNQTKADVEAILVANGSIAPRKEHGS